MPAEDLRVHGELVASGELAKVTLPGKARFLEWRSSTFKNAARLWQLIERHGGLAKRGPAAQATGGCWARVACGHRLATLSLGRPQTP